MVYLEHVIDKDGIRPQTSKVEAIQKMPLPSDPKELRSFLGMVNYYDRFIPGLATKCACLSDLLHKDRVWHMTLSAYDYEVQYKPSAQHGNADALSRLPLVGNDEYKCENEEIVCAVEEQQIENLLLRGKDIKKATEQDLVLSQVFNYTLHGWPSFVSAVPKNI